MTLLNVVNIAILIALAVGGFALYRHLRTKTDEADGVIDVNTRGFDGTSCEGVLLGAVGDSPEVDEASDDLTADAADAESSSIQKG